LAARDRGLPLPAGGAMLCPSTDMAKTGKVPEKLVAPISAASLRMGPTYLNGADPRTSSASPLYADLHGLPPLLIQVSTGEPLLDDSVRFAAKAKEAGVDCTLQTWEGLPHVWHLYAWMLPEGREAIANIGDFVRQRIPD